MSKKARGDTYFLVLLVLCRLSRLVLLLGLFAAALLQLLFVLFDDCFLLLGELFLLLPLRFSFRVDDRTGEATICQMRRTRVEEILVLFISMRLR